MDLGGVQSAAVVLALQAAWATPPTAQSLEHVATLYESRRYSDAARELDRLEAAREPAGRLWRARIQLAQGDHDGAIATLDSAVKQGQTTTGTHLWLARAYAARAQEASMLSALAAVRRAKRHWQLALERDPADLDARADLVGFHLSAPAIAGGDRRQARAEADAIAQRDPYRGAMERARIAAHNGLSDEAERTYRELIIGSPDRSAAYVQLALLLDARERWSEAFALEAQWTLALPQNVVAGYHRGRTAALSGTELSIGRSALESYVAAPEARGRPSHADAYYLQGLIDSKRGELGAARRALDTALSLEPNHRRARDLLKALGRR